MANHRHIYLEGFAQKADFESSRHPISGHVERNASTHSPTLREEYNSSIAAFGRESVIILQDIVEPVAGSYLSFLVEKVAMVEESLDTASGAQLMNVRPVDGNDQEEQVTLFLPQENNRWFSKKLNEYDREPEVVIDENGDTHTKKRKNQKLVNAISGIFTATLEDFFSSREELETILVGQPQTVEVWFTKDLYNDDKIRTKLCSLSIEHGLRSLEFPQVVILLVRATAHQLLQIVHTLPGITEFRLYRDPSVLLNADDIDAGEWVQLIQNDTIRANDPLVRIAVLDTGINPNHALLTNFLPNDRCFSVIESGNLLDQENHGTGLASLALYGDLTDVVYNKKRVKVTSDLTSIKILSRRPGEENPLKMYAVVTEDAIHVGRDSGANILCSAVTNQKHPIPDATATSTSATIDDALYNGGACDSVFLISAGNVEQTGGLPYPDYLYLSTIQDPAQAWNAITVGAYTEKVVLNNPLYRNHNTIAPARGISPFSRTSVQWGANAIKPEIVMEGGNAVLGINNSLDAPEDLSLVVAHAGDGLVPGQFQAFNATSAATGLAARLAAKIKYYNRNINSLSVRALMIHSAEWTQEMKDQCQNAHGELEVKTLLHSCGYGVPNEDKAIVSADSRVTFIAEDTITPFVMGSGGKLKFGHMNLYLMPWPKELLRSLADQQVRLKITLSYYVKPSPGIRSRLNKYNYQSIRLKFDVCGPHENRRDFENRIQLLTSEGDPRPRDPNLANRWTIGINNRNQGSICSDSFELSGIEMSECDMIAVYPSGGWFKNNSENLNIEVPYSLVVTLETASEEVMLYNAVEAIIANPIPVDVRL